MFTNRGHIRTNAAEGFGSRDGAEATSNLLLDFHHAQVAFGQIVVKGDAEIHHKAQDFGRALLQPQEQVAGFALFAAPALPGHGGGGRIGGQTLRQEGLVARREGFVRGRVQAFRARRAPLLNSALALAQESDHSLRPGLVALFDQRRQFAQVMRVAQGVLALRLPIRCPGIVDGNPVKEGQKANLICRRRAAFGVRGVVRQVRRAGHVQPVPLPRHRQPGLIKMRQRSRLHGGFEDGLERYQRRRRALLQGRERAGREAVPKEIGKQFAGTRLRQQLIGAQIDGHRLRARPVLDDVRDGRRKGGLGARLTMATDLVFAAMFGHGEGQDGQFKDLPSFIVQGRLGLPLLPAAGTLGDGVRLHLIGFVAQAQGRAAMARLPAHWARAFAAQAFRLFLEAILRGRLTTVARVALNLPFQFGDARRQLVKALQETLHQSDDGFRPGVIHGLDFVACHRQLIWLMR